MKIWLVNPYGPIPGEAWREYRFAMIGNALAARGHEVVWWTAAFDHYTKTRRSKTWKTIVVSESFSVTLVPTPSYRRNVGLGRIAFESMFAWRLLLRTKREPAPDLIVAADPPQIAGGVVALILRRRTGAAMLLDCLDLWPEVFAGVFPAGLRGIAGALLAPLRWLRAATYSRADAFTASCETYRRHITASVSTAPRHSTTVFLGIKSSENASEAGGLVHDPFQAIYAGSLGHNYDLDTVLDAARALLSDESFRFVIAGDGPLRERIRGRIAREKLDNVQCIGSLPASELAGWYGRSAVGLMPYAAWSTVAMPVKLFDYLAAGLPIVTSLSGELRELMDECDIGVSYRPGDAASLVEALRTLARDSARRQTMSANARDCARRFDRDDQYRRFADFAERTADDHRRSRGSGPAS